jgi:hypothetical protein
LHNINKLGGKVVSVTTDGFITDLENLESKLNTLPETDRPLLLKYQSLRKELSNCPEALEIKSSSLGVISWTTRGQLGETPKLAAATGFQRGGFEHNELRGIFKEILKTKDKFMEYTRHSLRSAKDIFNKGGHVTSIYKDQTFRLFFDNRREVIEPEEFAASGSVDLSNKLLDSKPLLNVNSCKTLRFFSKFPITVPYNKTNTNRTGSTYKSSLEIGVRNFIKAVYSTNEKFGLKGKEFRYIHELISFIYGFESTKHIKISLNSVSKLKNRNIIMKPVPRSRKNVAFCKYIKERFPEFREDLFLKPKS